MSALVVLVIQIRQPDHPMAEHERGCIVRRLGERDCVLRVVNVFAEPPDPSWLRGADVLIIGGSGAYSVHDPRSSSWVTPLRRVVEHALEAKMPSFGICFGHQLLAYHLGTPVNTDRKHAELGTTEVSLTACGLDDPVFGGLGPRVKVHTGHSDHADEVPAGVDLLATNERLLTQAFRVRGAPFYTTQFHPDLSGAEAIARYRSFRASTPVHEEESGPSSSELFAPGANSSAALLGWFVDHAITLRRT